MQNIYVDSNLHAVFSHVSENICATFADAKALAEINATAT